MTTGDGRNVVADPSWLRWMHKQAVVLMIVATGTAIFALLRWYQDTTVFWRMNSRELPVERIYVRGGKWLDVYMCPEMMPRYIWDIGFYVIDSDGQKYKMVCSFYDPFGYRAMIEKFLVDEQYKGKFDSFGDLIQKCGSSKSYTRSISPRWILLCDACLVWLVCVVIEWSRRKATLV